MKISREQIKQKRMQNVHDWQSLRLQSRGHFKLHFPLHFYFNYKSFAKPLSESIKSISNAHSFLNVIL